MSCICSLGDLSCSLLNSTSKYDLHAHQENQDEGLGRRGSWATAGGDGITGNSGGVAAAPNAGGVPGPVSLDGHRSHLKVGGASPTCADPVSSG